MAYPIHTRETLGVALLNQRLVRDEGFSTPCWLFDGYRTIGRHGGYGSKSVTFCGRKARPYRVHRLAAFVWMGLDLFGSLQVCHRCDVPGCFNPEHLFIGTQLDNMRDMNRKGRNNQAKGSAAGNAKLTEREVISIRRRRSDGDRVMDIAADVGITPAAVSNVIARRAWKHV